MTSTNYLIFGHGNGMPAEVYRNFLVPLSESLGLEVINARIEGFEQNNPGWMSHPDKNLWWRLTNEFTTEVQRIMKAHPNQTPILIGHSLGAWLALMSASRCGVGRVIAMDPVLLPTIRALQWNCLVSVGLRHLHPVASKVHRRATILPSLDAAREAFSRKSFFEGWQPEDLQAYIETNYQPSPAGENWVARRDFNTEGVIFASQPRSTLLAFSTIKSKARRTLDVHFLIGSRSDVCNLRAAPWLKLLFPRAIITPMKDAGHMFPFTAREQTLMHIAHHFNPMAAPQETKG